VALKFKFKCEQCNRTFPKQRSLNCHHGRWPNCSPDIERSRKGSLADKAVKHAKRVKQAAELPRVYIHEHELKNVLTFDYLGCRLSGDGDDTADIMHRMCIAQERFSQLHNIWRDSRLPRHMKLRLYKASVCSTFTHGCEAWLLRPTTVQKLNGFNSRCLHLITGRSYRSEAVSPTFNLVKAVRQRRMRWLGHILRMPDERLLSQAVRAIASDGPPYPTGSILMDCHEEFDELQTVADDRAVWNSICNNI
jgi:hypothetical protein